MKLSILKNVESGSITYYVGDDISHINHLSNCTLYCKRYFDDLDNVHQIVVEDPQLEFYKLSNTLIDEYTFNQKNNFIVGKNCNIHPTVVIGDDVIISDNVTIGPNSVIYSKTEIGSGTRIDANCSIGSEGMMWVWDGSERVFLKQLGGVKIGKNCIIGSNTVIVRGSANENTVIEEGVNLAPACAIGHGTYIGKNVHFANNISVGGSVHIAEFNFIGCGAVISPGIKITATDVLVGAGAVVSKNIEIEGVYVGIPVRRIKSTLGKLSGVPTWRV
jgi:UDP-3-O-[3-hydroxymyristoyl] glucosamine N-acyltransferase